MTIRLFITGLTMLATQLHANDNVFHSIVAQDGTGSFATIQDAIDAAPDSSATPYIIYIKAGHYHEHLYIPVSKPNLHLVGQSRRLHPPCLRVMFSHDGGACHGHLSGGYHL